jgi:hypothetical protein
MAYRWDGFDPARLWSVVIRLAPEAPKLICCASNRQCAHMKAYLRSLHVDNSSVWRKGCQETLLAVWNSFILRERPACVGTESAVGGLQTLEPVLSAHTEFPVTHDIERHHGDVLCFFTDDRELDEFRALRVIPEIVE